MTCRRNLQQNLWAFNQVTKGVVRKISFDQIAKPQWEFPRLCRGGSKSLTYPAVDTVGPSTKLRIVSSQAYEEEFHRWMTMKA